MSERKANCKSKRNNLRQSARDFAEETTFHGIKNILHEHSSMPRRVFWILLVAAMFIWSLVLISMSIHRYFQYNTITLIRQRVHSSLDFPSLLVCNFNVEKDGAMTERYPQLLAVHDAFFATDALVVNPTTVDFLKNVTLSDYYEQVQIFVSL